MPRKTRSRSSRTPATPTSSTGSSAGTPYSYVFDGQWGYLDYALGSASAVDQVAGIVEWHINSDEPSVLDYNTDFKSAGQIASLYAPDRFRVSDHDPIIVGLDADSDRPVVDGGGPYTVEEGGTTELTATGSDPTGDAVTYAWDLDGNGSFETAGATVTFAAGSRQAPPDGHRDRPDHRRERPVVDRHGRYRCDLGLRRLPVAVQPGRRDGHQGRLDAIPSSSRSTAIRARPSSMATPTFQRTDCTTGRRHRLADRDVRRTCPTTAATDTYKFIVEDRQGAGPAGAGRCRVDLADGQSYELDVRFRVGRPRLRRRPRDPPDPRPASACRAGSGPGTAAAGSTARNDPEAPTQIAVAQAEDRCDRAAEDRCRSGSCPTR